MNSKDLSLNLLLSRGVRIIYRMSIASHRPTPVFVEICIIRDLQNFSNYTVHVRKLAFSQLCYCIKGSYFVEIKQEIFNDTYPES